MTCHPNIRPIRFLGIQDINSILHKQKSPGKTAEATGSGRWIRTNDLWVMSPTSYPCSIPHYNSLMPFINISIFRTNALLIQQGMSPTSYPCSIPHYNSLMPFINISIFRTNALLIQQGMSPRSYPCSIPHYNFLLEYFRNAVQIYRFVFFITNYL